MDSSINIEKSEQKAASDEISIKTSRFGELKVKMDLIIQMTAPFPGFPESKHFVIIPHKKGSTFMWLQSLENPDLAFVVIQANYIKEDYAPPIPDLLKKELESTPETTLEILLILTIPPGRPREMTANLMGPVIINSKKRLARQLILDQDKYNPCWPVF